MFLSAAYHILISSFLQYLYKLTLVQPENRTKNNYTTAPQFPLQIAASGGIALKGFHKYTAWLDSFRTFLPLLHCFLLCHFSPSKSCFDQQKIFKMLIELSEIFRLQWELLHPIMGIAKNLIASLHRALSAWLQLEFTEF